MLFCSVCILSFSAEQQRPCHLSETDCALLASKQLQAAKSKARRKPGRRQPQLPRVAALCVDRRLIMPRREGFAVPDLARSEADFFCGVFASPRTTSSTKTGRLARPSTAMGIARAIGEKGEGDKFRQDNIERCRNSFRRLALDSRAARSTSSSNIKSQKPLDAKTAETARRRGMQDSRQDSGVLDPDAAQNAAGVANCMKVLMHPVTPTVQIRRYDCRRTRRSCNVLCHMKQ
jgi:hypothetical protein